MNRQTVIVLAPVPELFENFVIVSPAPECWGNFKKLCKAKGWAYQTLANQGKVPKIGQPVEVNGHVIHRVAFQ